MTWVRAVAVAGLLGGATLGASCNGSSNNAMQGEVDALQKALKADQNYMAENYQYMKRMSDAVCALEKVASPSPDPLTLLCKQGGTEVKSPPVYPLP